MHQHAGSMCATILRAGLVPEPHRANSILTITIPRRYRLELIDRKHAAADHDRMLLIDRLPAGISQLPLTLRQKIERL